HLRSQHTHELLPGFKDAPARGLFLDSEHLSDLMEGEILLHAQEEGSPIFCRQPADSAGQEPKGLTAEHLINGTLALRREIARERLTGALRRAPLVHEAVVSDPEQPGVKIVRRPKSRQAGKGLKKRFLREVFRSVAVMGQMVQPAGSPGRRACRWLARQGISL